MRRTILFIAVLLMLLSCNKEDSQTTQADKTSEQKTFNLTVDGNPRSFIVYLPSGYNNAGKMPMIFVIHGGSGTPEGMINIANFKTIADRDKVVLVYPAAFKKTGMTAGLRLRINQELMM
jgi:polyhydroxybutyrate depolymerase